MKLLLDEMYPGRVGGELRRRGHDVACVSDRPDLRGTDDEPLLMTATSEGRVLVTENVVDFPEIAVTFRSEERTQFGVVLVSSRTFPRSSRGFGLLVRALDAYLREHEAEHTIAGGVHWLATGGMGEGEPDPMPYDGGSSADE